MAKTGTDIHLPPVLLDTCALLFIALGKGLAEPADETVGASAQNGSLYVSPVSAWEIGMGASRGRLKLPTEPLSFFNGFVGRFGAALSPLTPDILIHSSFMPGEFHRDPMDRMLIATARLKDMIIITSDGAILNYAKAGHVQALAC